MGGFGPQGCALVRRHGARLRPCAASPTASARAPPHRVARRGHGHIAQRLPHKARRRSHAPAAASGGAAAPPPATLPLAASPLVTPTLSAASDGAGSIPPSPPSPTSLPPCEGGADGGWLEWPTQRAGSELAWTPLPRAPPCAWRVPLFAEHTAEELPAALPALAPLAGLQVAFVGDSTMRAIWESLHYALHASGYRDRPGNTLTAVAQMAGGAPPLLLVPVAHTSCAPCSAPTARTPRRTAPRR